MVRPLKIKISSDVLSPVSRQSLKDIIVAQIKDLIFSKKIKIGEKLPSERDLALQLKVGRAVVREALKSLEQSGLVEIRTGGAGGAYAVSDLHVPFFSAVMDLMNAGELEPGHFWQFGNIVESAAVRLAATSAVKSDIERLRQINSSLRNGGKSDIDNKEISIQFHLAIAEISQNQLLKLTVQSLSKMFQILSSSTLGQTESEEDMYQRHNDIIDAIERHDQKMAEKLMIHDNACHKRSIEDRNRSKNQ
jgi:GntR family transcriptional regulator, transcriptional repressor for pyruvate dehydrogenase complex